MGYEKYDYEKDPGYYVGVNPMCISCSFLVKILDERFHEGFVKCSKYGNSKPYNLNISCD